MMYIGKCKKGKIIFSAIANTPMEQAECAVDIRKLIKQGFEVELTDKKYTTDDWCFVGRKGCKQCLNQKK